MEEDFQAFWEQFDPDAQFDNRRKATYNLWCQCPQKKREAILLWLKNNRPKPGKNPYFFIQDFTVRMKFLSYRDYYARYGTTEEQDGWRMVKPQHGNVYYEKN